VKPLDLIGRRPPSRKRIQELKGLNGCASALSQQGVGQALLSLEPQTCYGLWPKQLDGAGAPIVFWGGGRRRGRAGLTFGEFTPPRLDPDE